MHEFGVVEQLIGEVKAQLAPQGITHVSEIHFRRGSTFSEDALRMAFQALSAGTPLEGAKVVVDMVPVNFRCGCSYTQVITPDDLEGHMYICPACGAIHEIEEADDLTLTRIVGEE